MILVLSGPGEEARELSVRLDQNNIEHLCFFSSFADAGNFGKGNVYVGKLNEREAEQLLRSNGIHGVVDVAQEDNLMQSLTAMKACEFCDIPYVKYIRIPKPKDSCDHVRVMGSLRAIAELMNEQEDKVLFYASPKTVRKIASYVTDTSKLFTTIQRGATFDVDLALEFGIPLLQVMENDSLDGEEAVLYAIHKTGATMLVCDTTVATSDKIAVAEKQGMPVILTHGTGVEYSKVVHSADAVMAQLCTWNEREKL